MADQGAEGLLSPWLRSKRFEAAQPFIIGRTLDFGCGSGELASFIPSDNYSGIDKDEGSLRIARTKYPQHHFKSSLSNENGKFDTIVSLAVIEHVSEPAMFLRTLANHLNDSKDSRIIITTPHPSVDWIHGVGAAIGLFSKHANEEHDELLNRNKLVKAGKHADITMIHYKRFLFGANQIAVYKKQKP